MVTSHSTAGRTWKQSGAVCGSASAESLRFLLPASSVFSRLPSRERTLYCGSVMADSGQVVRVLRKLNRALASDLATAPLGSKDVLDPLSASELRLYAIRRASEDWDSRMLHRMITSASNVLNLARVRECAMGS